MPFLFYPMTQELALVASEDKHGKRTDEPLDTAGRIRIAYDENGNVSGVTVKVCREAEFKEPNADFRSFVMQLNAVLNGADLNELKGALEAAQNELSRLPHDNAAFLKCVELLKRHGLFDAAHAKTE